MADRVAEGFSIGVLAARAGVTPGVLRTWENRFGFPRGERSASGHRRFTDADVALVRQVLEVRDSGLPLQVAIDAQLEALGHGPSPVGYFDVAGLFDRTFHLSVPGLEYPRRDLPGTIVFTGPLPAPRPDLPQRAWTPPPGACPASRPRFPEPSPPAPRARRPLPATATSPGPAAIHRR